MKFIPWFPARRISFVSFILLIGALPSIAQTRQNVIGQILIDSPSRYSASQIALGSGLRTGEPGNDKVLSEAADRLANSGAFSEVSYRYTTANGKLTVTFHVIDQPKTLLATFDNFVWFRPEELDSAVRSEVALFDGRLPLDGPLGPAVAAALEHLLAQRHIAATVGFIPAAKTIGAPPSEFRFSARGNLPPVTEVQYIGGPLDTSLFAVATKRLVGHPFSAAYSRLMAEDELDVIYQNHAYLRAHFGDPQIVLTPGAGDQDPGSVKLIFTVVPGSQYAWHGADWHGNAAYAPADLDRFLGLKDGDPAALNAILSGMDAVRQGYGKKGFMMLNLASKQDFDDAALQVRYSFEVTEGGQFHMGELTVTGADAKTSDSIRKVWRLKTGDIFDASYVKEFQAKDLPLALRDSPSAARPSRITISTMANKETLTINATVSIQPN